MTTKEDLIEGVREYALCNYEKDGWDYVVECWSDKEIAEEIGNCRTVKGAIRKMREAINPLYSYEQEIKSTDW